MDEEGPPAVLRSPSPQREKSKRKTRQSEEPHAAMVSNLHQAWRNHIYYAHSSAQTHAGMEKANGRNALIWRKRLRRLLPPSPITAAHGSRSIALCIQLRIGLFCECNTDHSFLHVQSWGSYVRRQQHILWAVQGCCVAGDLSQEDVNHDNEYIQMMLRCLHS